MGDGDYAERSRFLEAVIMSCQAVIDYADRYAKLALEMAEKCTDPQRKAELLVIASNCSKVPAKGATNFWEACQSFWFVQQLLQMESSGHSISPGRILIIRRILRAARLPEQQPRSFLIASG